MEEVNNGDSAHLLMHFDISPQSLDTQEHSQNYKTTDSQQHKVSATQVSSKRKNIRHRSVSGRLCHVCGKLQLNQRELEHHLNIHEDIRPFSCAICGYSSHGKSTMNLHIWRQHTSQDVKQDTEERTMVDSGLIDESGQEQSTEQIRSDVSSKKHSNHPAVQSLSSLGEGGLRCWSQTNLSDCGERTFVCDQCAKVFPTKIGLGDHVAAVHSTARRHACPHCERRFAVARELTRHIKTKHSTYIPPRKRSNCYEVDSLDSVHQSPLSVGRSDCGSQSRLAGSSERTFECEQCEKAFQTKIGLNDHVAAMHCTVRCHACLLCERRFAVARELTRHIKTKHSMHTALS